MLKWIFRIRKYIFLYIMLVNVLFLSGCVDLTAQRSPLADGRVYPSNIDHANIFIMRGFLGIFSRGMDTLSKRCNQELQLHSVSLAAHEWPQLTAYLIARQQQGKLLHPLILVGHSEGADDQIEVARRLACFNIPVDLLVLIGPFAPNTVPANVRTVYILDRSFVVGKVIPFMGNVPVKIMDPNHTRVEELDMGYTKMNFNTFTINHFNLDKSREAQNLVLTKIKYAQQQGKICHKSDPLPTGNSCQQQFCQRFLRSMKPLIMSH